MLQEAVVGGCIGGHVAAKTVGGYNGGGGYSAGGYTMVACSLYISSCIGSLG